MTECHETQYAPAQVLQKLLADIVNSNRKILAEVEATQEQLSEVTSTRNVDHTADIRNLAIRVEKLTDYVAEVAAQTSILLKVVGRNSDTERVEVPTVIVQTDRRETDPKMKSIVEIYDSLNGVVKTLLWLAGVAAAISALLELWNNVH